MTNAEQITQAVHRYVDLMTAGDIDGLAALYAEDATVEDPVGAELRIGRDAIHAFYANFAHVKGTAELLTLRVSGNEAAFHFRLTADFGDGSGATVIEPIDVMVFDDAGKIAVMKAYWSEDEAIRLPSKD